MQSPYYTYLSMWLHACEIRTDYYTHVPAVVSLLNSLRPLIHLMLTIMQTIHLHIHKRNNRTLYGLYRIMVAAWIACHSCKWERVCLENDSIPYLLRFQDYHPNHYSTILADKITLLTPPCIIWILYWEVNADYYTKICKKSEFFLKHTQV